MPYITAFFLNLGNCCPKSTYITIKEKYTNHKRKYLDFCQARPTIIFNEPWWLDSLCEPDQWNVALASSQSNSSIEAALPYFQKSKLGFSQMRMPPFTPYFQLQINTGKKQPYKVNNYQLNVLSRLSAQLPDTSFAYLDIETNSNIALGFHWLGYTNHIRYTYRITDLLTPQDLTSTFSYDVRRTLGKLANSVRVKTIEDLELFYKVLSYTYKRQNTALPLSLVYLMASQIKTLLAPVS